MTTLLFSMRRFILFFLLIHTVALYRIYPSDESSSNEDVNQVLSMKNLHGNWLSHLSDVKDGEEEEPVWKRSIFAKDLRSLSLMPQRRNSRPHWNPLVAAYKRCGELSTADERESCFKNAIQMLFVHKLRK